MVDPFSVCGALIASMQFMLQLKAYIEERKRRRRQEQEAHQQQYHANAAHVQHTPIIFYSIYCHVQYQPSPCLQHYWPNHNPHPSTPYTAVLPYVAQRPFYYSQQAINTSSGSCGRPYTLPQYDWLGLLGGRLQRIEAAPPQGAIYGQYGMRMLSHPYHNDPYAHWKSLQDSSYEESIAVVNFSMGSIDMFVKADCTYFRSYQITTCDVAMFAYLFKDSEIFTGEISQQRLERFNKKIEVVENYYHLRSTNSWMSIGILDATVDKIEYNQPMFVSIVRGAIFGLICCLYETPHDLEVEMEFSHHALDIVRISANESQLQLSKRQHSLFSVFSLGRSDWAKQQILIG